MRKRSAIAGAAIALSVALALPAAAQWRVGPWSGSGYRSKATGQFSYCQIWGRYQNGIWLFFRQYPDYSVRVGMQRHDWRLVPGGRYTMTFVIDGRQIRQARGVVEKHRLTRIWLALGNDRYTRDRLRRGFNLTLINNRQRYHFQLQSTSVGLGALERCVTRNRQG